MHDNSHEFKCFCCHLARNRMFFFVSRRMASSLTIAITLLSEKVCIFWGDVYPFSKATEWPQKTVRSWKRALCVFFYVIWWDLFFILMREKKLSLKVWFVSKRFRFLKRSWMFEEKIVLFLFLMSSVLTWWFSVFSTEKQTEIWKCRSS